MFIPKRLHQKDYQFIQDALIRFYNTRPDEYGLLERPEAVYTEYAKFINNYTNNKDVIILDLGSGTWRIPLEIAKYGYKEVIGLDYFSDEKMQDYSTNLIGTCAKLMNYQTEKIPLENESVDVVTSLCVIEHLIYVEDMLNEIDRVLKPGGLSIIICPNWSGPNPAITALKYNLKGNRYWRHETFISSLTFLFRSFFWYLEILFSQKNKFILIYPNMKDGEINFERSDDDAVHLSQPLSLKRYFNRKNYQILKYNSGSGTTSYSRLFNKLFPSFATTNEIVVRKP
jgi:SAM-dependent methyltransferase